MQGLVEETKLLIESGADMDCVDDHGWVLCLVILKSLSPVNTEPITNEINHLFPNAQTPLHFATYNRQFEVANQLLTAGANRKIKTNMGEVCVLVDAVPHYKIKLLTKRLLTNVQICPQ